MAEKNTQEITITFTVSISEMDDPAVHQLLGMVAQYQRKKLPPTTVAVSRKEPILNFDWLRKLAPEFDVGNTFQISTLEIEILDPKVQKLNPEAKEKVRVAYNHIVDYLSSLTESKVKEICEFVFSFDWNVISGLVDVYLEIFINRDEPIDINAIGSMLGFYSDFIEIVSSKV